MGRPSNGQAKTAAERMAAYRARRAGDAEQLNLFIFPEAMAALRRLARHHDVTHASALAHMIKEAESALLASMTPAERKAYRAPQ